MKDIRSERRLAENEVVFRQLNEQVQKSIDEVNEMARSSGQAHFSIQQTKDDAPLHFYCECSEVECVMRVVLSHHEYNRIHKRRDHFVVLPGHQTAGIEKIVEEHKGFIVVEKFILPPTEVGSVRPSKEIDNK